MHDLEPSLPRRVGDGKIEMPMRAETKMAIALRMGAATVVAASAFVMAARIGAHAAGPDRYSDCIDAIGRNAEQALDAALTWADLGGGDGARHCVAVALARLGRFAEAALAFEAVAKEMEADAVVRAQVLGQAANAWLLADDSGRAAVAATMALELDPDGADLLVDRATAFAALGRYDEAVDDLDRALVLDPGLVDAYVFRASARRHLGDAARAEADVEIALRLDAEHAEGLLERGTLRRLRGDLAGARRDWIAVLTIAPDSAAAEAARAKLERMDVKVE